MGQYLISSTFADGHEKSVQLDRLGSTYVFKMVMKEGSEHDPELIKDIQEMTKLISEEVFNGAALDFHICDDTFNTIRIFSKS